MLGTKEMENRLVVVVGSTGRQGQSAVKNLLKKGYNVRALVRNPKKVNALLKRDDVEIYKGDLKSKESLNGLFSNAYGLFFALPFTKDSIGYGKTLLDVAKESKLEHIIYSSVGGADRYSKVDHFRYKKEIEEYLRKLGKPYSIIRPAGFMDEFANPKSIRFITGLLKLYLPKNKIFQLISIQDIGKFVAIAFDNPNRYIGKEFEIAGDELTLDSIFEKIEKVKNIKMSPMRIPKFIIYMTPKIMKQMFTFYAEDGWHADLKLLREENPELLSFEDWLKTTDAYEIYT